MPQPTSNRRQSANAQPVSIQGKLQPQDIPMEQAVLGALMLEKDAYSQVSEILTPDTFYEKKHQLIYTAIQELALAQNPIDMSTVTYQLQHDGTLDQIGGPLYIS